MFKPIPAPETAHLGLPAGPGLRIPSVLFHALVLDSKLDAGDDADPETLELNQENLDAGARYIEALLTLAQNGTRDQMVRHLAWFRDRLRAQSFNRSEELREHNAIERASVVRHAGA
jgi:hypothetical protein